MENREQWKEWPAASSRDYGWLVCALRLFDGTVKEAEGAACLRFAGGSNGISFAERYGLGPKTAVRFILEKEAGGCPAAVWHTLLGEEEGPVCTPVKTGRPQLLWELGLTLTAIRPLALLRPFYLFYGGIETRGETETILLSHTKQLDKQLQEGMAGVGYRALTDEVLLARRAGGTAKK